MKDICTFVFSVSMKRVALVCCLFVVSNVFVPFSMMAAWGDSKIVVKANQVDGKDAHEVNGLLAWLNSSLSSVATDEVTAIGTGTYEFGLVSDDKKIYVWAYAGYGYQFTSWALQNSTGGSFDMSDAEKQKQFGALVVANGGYVRRATTYSCDAVATFSRRQVTVDALNAPITAPEVTLSWKDVDVTVEGFSFSESYALSTADLSVAPVAVAATDGWLTQTPSITNTTVGKTLSDRTKKTEDHTGVVDPENKGSVIVQNTYALTGDVTNWKAGAYARAFTLAPASGATTANSKTVTSNVTVDLKPEFEIVSKAALTQNAEAGVALTFPIEITNFGSLPITHENLTWVASFSDHTDEFSADPEAEIVYVEGDATKAVFNVTFLSPTVSGQYETTLTLKATWVDANGASHVAEHTLDLVAKEAVYGHFTIRKGSKTGALVTDDAVSYDMVDGEWILTPQRLYVEDDFSITNDTWQFVSDATQDPEQLFQAAIDPSNEFFTVTGTFDETKVYTTRISVSGESNGIDAGERIAHYVDVTVKCWYKPIYLTVDYVVGDDHAMILHWDKAAYADRYILEMKKGDGAFTPIQTFEGNTTLTHTVTGLETGYMYTFRIKTVIDAINKSYYTNEARRSLIIFAPGEDQWTDMGVDASAAYDVEGMPIMDRLYILDHVNNKCHVYEVTADGSKYIKIDEADPRSWRPGLIDGTKASFFPKDAPADKKDNMRIYITGKCEVGTDDKGGLFFNDVVTERDPYAKMGWMQPINCEIYLDNVRLQAAVVHKIDDERYYIPINGMNQKSNRSGFLYRKPVAHSASVFYLMDKEGQNTQTTFHTRGKNYLGGGVGGTMEIRMQIHADLEVREMGPWEGYYYTPNYSSPIAIKDASLLDDRLFMPHNAKDAVELTATMKTNHAAVIKDPYNIPAAEDLEIVCRFDTIWPVAIDATVPAYLDLSSRVCQYNDSASTDITTKRVWGYTEDLNAGPQYYSYDYGTGVGCTNYNLNPVVEDKTPFQTDGFRRWRNVMGQRYAPALTTGGKHGKFVIDGGHVNLWPANGNLQKLFYFHYTRKIATVVGIDADVSMQTKINGGDAANYLVCGASAWFTLMSKTMFDGTKLEGHNTAASLAMSILGVGDAFGEMIGSWNPIPGLIFYGFGNGYPVGYLTINGGTITSDTDEQSFAYNYIGYDADGNAYPKTGTNIVNNQPLIAPNVEINGGTFRNRIFTANYNPANNVNDYALTVADVTPTTKWDETFTIDFKNRVSSGDTDVKNASVHGGEELKRTEVHMDTKGNVDYSYLNEGDVLHSEAANRESPVNYIVNIGKDNEYKYGMANVHSDNDGMCYFYLPKDCTHDKYGNFYVADGEALETFGDVKPYNLTVEKGGVLNEPGSDVDGTFKVYGTPKYLIPAGKVKEDIYAPIAMPFDVATFVVNDGEEFSFDAYVERDDNADADNSNAYCYVYFLDKSGTGQNGGADISTQWTQGLDNTFRNNYHTHTDGLMRRGKTYILKFPRASGGLTAEGKPYWESYPITLVGAKGTIVNGALAYEKQLRNPRPTNGNTSTPEFYMDGNATFAQQPQLRVTNGIDAGELYEVNVDKYDDDDFHATAGTAIAPLQGYVLGATEVMKIHRVLGRGNSNGNNTTTGLGNTSAEWSVYAHGGYIYVTPVADSTMMLYTVDGQLVGTYPMVSGAQTIIPAAAGMYILRSGDAVAKVLVE